MQQAVCPPFSLQRWKHLAIGLQISHSLPYMLDPQKSLLSVLSISLDLFVRETGSDCMRM